MIYFIKAEIIKIKKWRYEVPLIANSMAASSTSGLNPPAPSNCNDKKFH